MYPSAQRRELVTLLAKSCDFGFHSEGFPGGANDKEPVCQCRRHQRHRFDPCVRKTPWSRKWQPAPIFLPGKSHRQRSLVGYRPSGCKELDTTKPICTHTHTHTHTHTEGWRHAVSFHHICLLHVTSCLDDYTSLLPVQSCSPPTPALLKHQPAHFLFWRGSPLPADKAQFAQVVFRLHQKW